MSNFQPTYNADVASISPQNIFASDYPAKRLAITIASGAGSLIAGTVLGKVTASGKYVKSASASSDGSQTPLVILTEDVDATSADKVSVAYETGDFVESFLILGTGHTIASIRDGLRARGIFISAEAKDEV